MTFNILRHRLAPCALLWAAWASIGAAQAADTASSWQTRADRTRLLAREPDSQFKAGQKALPLHIEVDAGQRFQTMEGFGAAISDASAWLIQQRMSEPQRRALLAELFGRGPAGIGFDLSRLTIGGSDFSRSHYSYLDLPPGQTDMSLAGFSIEPNRADVLPVVKAALAVNPQLQLMASPWSAPGWMKQTDSLIKGRLKPEMYGVFSEYLVRYVDAFAAEGVPIFALTVQNEPHHEPDDYPGMLVDPAERAALVGQHLGPLLAQRGMKTQLIEWDHNWDEVKSPLAVLADPVARRYVSGVGWHCYAGDVQAQTVVHEAHPDKDTWFTECSGGEWAPEWHKTLPWMMKNLVIGSTRGWAKGVLMWNLALDENYGPHLGGCKDCRGVVTINSKTGAVTRNIEYYALGHASKFVRRGAQRIASPAQVGGMDTVAFRNADDGSIALIVSNGEAHNRRFTVGSGARRFAYTLPKHSVVTFTWAGQP
ncbi:glycoside hydrolase family 30 protein [Paucibacter sp. DJ2R-2]|uniref:glycoside hydrolase family 30 protein n=1 Tax=Paucibacter sp. DJ2R-2 TaxID=2893558 RepID=UPI0021E3E012|nr:glycoside hydrolase family 30 beta sandwich domain-containing protein [Paucibacter sp. DJ2R-2]MCV2420484.1 glycosyl hydrolase [Paucibacter sp. DJ4R-1]MCV2439662.1 glycosyl hydrolase [Paucibacter sp. DJ2R-2]